MRTFTHSNVTLRQHGELKGKFNISGRVNGGAVIVVEEAEAPKNASTLAFVEKAKGYIQNEEKIMPSQMTLFYRTGYYLFQHNGDMLRLASEKTLQKYISEVEEKEVA